MRLQEQVALVTGAASGIGRATALRLAQDGARVVAADIAPPSALVEEIVAAGGAAVAVQGSVAKAADVAAMVRAATEQWGRLDIVAHIAGITRDALSLKMSEEQWDTVLEVNLKGSFLVAREAAAAMKAREYGRIILTASAPSLRGNVGQANYAASKAGVVGLVRTLALEYARYKVTVNAVAPGATETPMTSTIPEPIKAAITNRVPLKRFAQPEEIAALYAFLGSPEADYITGQTIMADGGITIGTV